MKNFFYAIITGVMLTMSLAACSNDDNDSNRVEPTAELETALREKFPTARNVEWEHIGPYYIAEFDDNNHEIEAWFDSSARWLMSEIDMGRSLLSVPTAVATAFAGGEYSTWQIDEIYYYQRLDRDFYVIEIKNPGQADRELYYNPDGSLIKDVPDMDHPRLPESEL